MPIRVRLDLAYDGTDFHGWAAQPGLRTVEGELSAALARVLRLDESPSLTVAGRTDAGVHARGQVVHVDLPDEPWAALPGRSDRSPGQALVARLRGVLPPDVDVRAARPAPKGFDARFSATMASVRAISADFRFAALGVMAAWSVLGVFLSLYPALVQHVTGHGSVIFTGGLVAVMAIASAISQFIGADMMAQRWERPSSRSRASPSWNGSPMA